MPADPNSGSHVDNLPLPGAHVAIYAVDPANAAAPFYDKTVAADGRWGPFTAHSATPYEFAVSAPGHATTHSCRSASPRSSHIVHLQALRIADADKDAPAGRPWPTANNELAVLELTH